MSRNNAEIFPKVAGAYQLGEFVFSTATGLLTDTDGNEMHLRKQTIEVLTCLLRRANEVVPKADLFDEVWPGSSVTDDSLVQCISELRRTLKDTGHAIIQTASKRGYKVAAAPLQTDQTSSLPEPEGPPSIAVLAFEDFSVGADANYLSDAIAEGIIAGLSRFSELLVIARNSSFSFRGTPTRVQDIAGSLGVRYLLEGSQQKSGERLRTTVQLIDAATGHHLWSEVYEGDIAELFVVQDDVVQRVVATVAQKVITSEGRPPRRSDPAGRSALLHHLEGRQHLIKFTPEGNELARRANIASIRADPTLPYGYAGLAFVHINGYRWGWTEGSAAQALIDARTAARKAVELGPDYYDGHAAMAYVHLQENDLDRAIVRAQRALDLNPNDTCVMCDLAEYLGYAGQYEDAERLLAKAMRLDPLYPDWIRWNMAWVQWLAGESEAALETMNGMTEIPPMANRVLAVIYISLGQQKKAQEVVKRLLTYDPGYSLRDVRRNYSGKFRKASDLERVISSLRQAGVP